MSLVSDKARALRQLDGMDHFLTTEGSNDDSLRLRPSISLAHLGFTPISHCGESEEGSPVYPPGEAPDRVTVWNPAVDEPLRFHCRRRILTMQLWVAVDPVRSYIERADPDFGETALVFDRTYNLPQAVTVDGSFVTVTDGHHRIAAAALIGWPLWVSLKRGSHVSEQAAA